MKIRVDINTLNHSTVLFAFGEGGWAGAHNQIDECTVEISFDEKTELNYALKVMESLCESKIAFQVLDSDA
jgi:hypothetical protein